MGFPGNGAPDAVRLWNEGILCRKSIVKQTVVCHCFHLNFQIEEKAMLHEFLSLFLRVMKPEPKANNYVCRFVLLKICKMNNT